MGEKIGLRSPARFFLPADPSRSKRRSLRRESGAANAVPYRPPTLPQADTTVDDRHDKRCEAAPPDLPTPPTAAKKFVRQCRQSPNRGLVQRGRYRLLGLVDPRCPLPPEYQNEDQELRQLERPVSRPIQPSLEFSERSRLAFGVSRSPHRTRPDWLHQINRSLRHRSDRLPSRHIVGTAKNLWAGELCEADRTAVDRTAVTRRALR